MEKIVRIFDSYTINVGKELYEILISDCKWEGLSILKNE